MHTSKHAHLDTIQIKFRWWQPFVLSLFSYLFHFCLLLKKGEEKKVEEDDDENSNATTFESGTFNTRKTNFKSPYPFPQQLTNKTFNPKTKNAKSLSQPLRNKESADIPKDAARAEVQLILAPVSLRSSVSIGQSKRNLFTRGCVPRRAAMLPLRFGLCFPVRSGFLRGYCCLLFVCLFGLVWCCYIFCFCWFCLIRFLEELLLFVVFVLLSFFVKK